MLISLLSLPIVFITFFSGGASASPLFIVNNTTATRHGARGTIEVVGDRFAWEARRIRCKYADAKLPASGEMKVVRTQNGVDELEFQSRDKAYRTDESKSGVKTRRGINDLKAEFFKVAPIVDVAIGNPPQVMRMLLDTGSGGIITTVKSKSVACSTDDPKCDDTVPRFNPALSETLQDIPGLFTIGFTCSAVAGRVGMDTIRLLNTQLDDFPFGMIDHVEGDAFWTTQVSGILGVNVQTFIDHPVLKEPPIVSLFGAKQWNKNALSLSFREGSPATTIFGDIPKSKIQWHQMYPPDSPFWSIKLSGVAINTLSVIGLDIATLVDSGTEMFWIPKKMASTFYSDIPGVQSDPTKTQWFFPCDTPALNDPKITVTLGGVTYDIPAEDLNVGPGYESTGKLCMGAILGHDANYGIMGWAFLKNRLAVFDYDNKRIGFGSVV